MSTAQSSSKTAALVSQYGASVKGKLTGPGEREAALITPLDTFLTAMSEALDVKGVSLHSETRDADRQVRPDFSVSVEGMTVGHIEVKAPDKSIAPTSFRGHDKRQWEKQKDLPNVLYTNGSEFRLYRDGKPVGQPVVLAGGDLTQAGPALTAPSGFDDMLRTFLGWKPLPIKSMSALVRAIAPITRLLRHEVLDQLRTEAGSIAAGGKKAKQPFHGLAKDWRRLLFPDATDETFADGYAQTVTFALLLARSQGRSVTKGSLHDVGNDLQAGNVLMGTALKLLTDPVAEDFVTLNVLTRVVEAVDWSAIRSRKGDPFLHLYEDFLEQYDNTLRKQTGTYYTPQTVVDSMVRLVEDCLVQIGVADGYNDDAVNLVDPAMGTGTFLERVIDHVAERAAADNGRGAVPAAVAEAITRLYGFEIQMGPYSVAEMRMADVLRKHGATMTERPRLFVTDTLDDPYEHVQDLGYGLSAITENRRAANAVKTTTRVTVVLGNPPYRERAEGLGGWVEDGSGVVEGKPPLDAFRAEGNGKHERHLKNLYIYFWRWATWKVWESTPDDETGVVCFITTSGYLTGPGFKGMRAYLRRNASRGWIVNLTPEGQTPDVPTRIFPGVRQPLCIGIFVREPNTDPTSPAEVMSISLHGCQQAKFDALSALSLTDGGWASVREGWDAPFTPAATSNWDRYPAMGDLIPWVGPGIKASRTWVFAPSRAVLDQRWRSLTAAQDRSEKQQLLKVSPGVDVDRHPDRLPGADTTQFTAAIEKELPAQTAPAVVEVGYRSFDRQYVLPDSRLMQRPGPLWHARVDGQIFAIEQHAHPIDSGPGLVFTHLIPDLHHFKGSEGGRALPMLQPDRAPNTAPGLLDALSAAFGRRVTGEDLYAYLAAVIAHPGYTATFVDELTTPGIRVPLTAEPDLFWEAVDLGRYLLWCHTFGTRFTDPERPAGKVRYRPADAVSGPTLSQAITQMPESMGYDESAEQVSIGTGVVDNVTEAVWEYAVGGKRVLGSWFNYRKANPGGRRSSPLDEMNESTWPSAWNGDLLDLITVLDRVTRAEKKQADLLSRVLASDVLDTGTLASRGVTWPTTNADRKPRSQKDHPLSLDFFATTDERRDWT